MRWWNVTLLGLLVAGAAGLLLLGDGSRNVGPRAAQEETAQPSSQEVLRPVPLTGTLLIRLKTADGTPVPDDARAGYVRFGTPRLRPPAKDGTFRFTDAPVGRLDVTAEAKGWISDTVAVTLIGGVAAEAVVTLTAPKAPPSSDQK